jgi:hypothetical protein
MPRPVIESPGYAAAIDRNRLRCTSQCLLGTKRQTLALFAVGQLWAVKGPVEITSAVRKPAQGQDLRRIYVERRETLKWCLASCGVSSLQTRVPCCDPDRCRVGVAVKFTYLRGTLSPTSLLRGAPGEPRTCLLIEQLGTSSAPMACPQITHSDIPTSFPGAWTLRPQ